MPKRGKYIVIEGHDGTGKSAQRDLLSQRLGGLGITVAHTLEPGGTPIGDILRTTLKDGSLERQPATNLLLLTANRLELWTQFIKPKLEQGIWVISDRLWWSCVAYQGFGEGLTADTVIATTKNFAGEQYMQPDVGIVLSLNDEQERQRRTAQSADMQKDTFEQKDAGFQQRVKEGYEYVTQHLGAAAVEFSPNATKEQVADLVWQKIEPLLETE